MALPGLLVEYLVIGSMALLWLLPLVTESCGPIDIGTAAILAPSLYVLGMFIDILAFLLVSRFPRRTHSLKSLVRCIVRHKSDIKKTDDNVFLQDYGRTTRGTIWLYLENAPELVNEVKARSSRDRVARGAIVNIVIMWIMSSVGYPGLLLPSEVLGNHWFWGVLTGFSMLAWGLLEFHSYGFELRAGEMVSKAKLARTGTPDVVRVVSTVRRPE